MKKEIQIGDTGIITDKDSLFVGENATVTGDLGNMLKVLVGQRTVIVSKQGLKVDSTNSTNGGAGIDLFEDNKNIPPKVQKIIDKYEDGFMDGNYAQLEKALKELKKIGYTFEYYLDGQAYDLRPIGTKGKTETENQKYANGGKIKKSKMDKKWSKKIDSSIKAKKAGFRKTQNGGYYEYRSNRSDVNPKKKLEWGGTAESSETGTPIGGENQSSMYKNGGGVGSISNQYNGKTGKKVWESWTATQKNHFLRDHFHSVGKKLPNKNIFAMEWIELPLYLQNAVSNHVYAGQYEKGGSVGSSFEYTIGGL